jgi:galactonate dehydratase
VKITDLQFHVYAPIPALPWSFVEVHTDEGVVGLGECTDYRGTPLLADGIEAIKPIVVGADPANIEEIWQRIFRHYTTFSGRGYISHLISGIDVALWDLRGKVLGQPIYRLIGGPVRETVPLYTHIQDQWYEGVTIADAVRWAKETKADGYEAFKTDPFKWQGQRLGGGHWGANRVEYLNPKSIAEAVDWIAAVREAVGDDYELMVDAHGRFDVASAIKGARALEPFNLIWYEEPVPPESFAALREVREATSIPICVGERLFTRYDFVPVFEQRLADFIMPDILWTGGISEIKKIAAMAEAYYVRISPHDALGPVSIMAGAHVSITTPNFYRLECLHRWFPDFAKIITPMFTVRSGAIVLSDRPGLGFELDHEAAARYRVDPHSPAATPGSSESPTSRRRAGAAVSRGRARR